MKMYRNRFKKELTKCHEQFNMLNSSFEDELEDAEEWNDMFVAYDQTFEPLKYTQSNSVAFNYLADLQHKGSGAQYLQ